MTENVYKFPEQSATEEEAAAWLIRLDRTEPPTPEEHNALREWLGRSPAHRRELNELAVLWGKMNVLTELAVPLGKPLRTKATRPRPRMAAAAVLLLGIGAVLLVHRSKDQLTAGNATYATAVGQQRTATLADGTVIQLNTDSQLKVDFNPHARDVRLIQGEAYFTVAKNAALPFRVYAGNGRIQAVGTAFSVYLKDKNVNVTVTEGRVALATVTAPAPVLPVERPKSPSIENLGTLEAGQAVTLENTPVTQPTAPPGISAVETVDPSQLARELSWRHGLLIFNGEPLDRVVAELSRYTKIAIDIPDPKVKAIKIGGQFRVDDIDGMFAALETNFGLHVIHLSDDHVRLAF